MFGFGRGAGEPQRSAESEDLLALSEAAEFEASVRAAKERIASRADGQTGAQEPPPDPDAEITWTDQPDVYRPRHADAQAHLDALGLRGAPTVRAGQSFTVIRGAAFAAIQQHLLSNVQIELGGLLGGEAIYDPAMDLFLIVVETALPALNGDGTATSFTYTAKAWEAILPAWLEMNSAWTIVGSYHSHPGMGVFLSSTDLTTQVEVFPHDWQIAVVVDPIADRCGVFTGASGRPCEYAVT